MKTEQIRFVGVGDSWNAGFDDLTRTDKGGWLAKLDPSRFSCTANLAVSGSAAAQWASGHGGWLDKAVAMADETDAYFVSLLGNDAYAYISEASEGGRTVTFSEQKKAVSDIRKVVSALKATGKRVMVMLYTNPYPQNAFTDMGCTALNAAIIYGTGSLIEGSDYIQSDLALSATGMMSGKGIHPSDEGYGALAKLVEGMFR